MDDCFSMFRTMSALTSDGLTLSLLCRRATQVTLFYYEVQKKCVRTKFQTTIGEERLNVELCSSTIEGRGKSRTPFSFQQLKSSMVFLTCAPCPLFDACAEVWRFDVWSDERWGGMKKVAKP